MRLEDFLERLDHVRKSGTGYTARCPAHEDQKNSLSVTSKEGKILLKCFAGCSAEAIVFVLGLQLSDLMPPKDDRPPPHKNKETIYKIQLPGGECVEHVRIDGPDGKKFFWRRNGSNGLGGLRVVDVPLFAPAEQGDSRGMVICEGEKAAIASAKLGFQSYGTVCGASACPSKDVLRHVAGDKDVVLWADADDPGKAHMEKISTALSGIAKSVVTITVGDEGDDAADFRGTREDVRKIISAAMPKDESPRTRLLAHSLPGALASLARYSSGDHADRVPLGIKKVDQALRGGMIRGGLYLLGAPSGHGKTTLLQGVAAECARRRGPVLFVSPEMSGEELAEREIIRKSGVPMIKRAPWLPDEERRAAVEAHQMAAVTIGREELPVHVVEDVEITMGDVLERAAAITGLRLVIIDYAQEVADRASSVARYLAVGEVGKDSIAMGKELGIPVIVASQVNVSKTDKGSLEYAFRETKDLENRSHASMIMEVKRSSVANQHGYHPVESTRIFARKNRSGPLFDVRLNYKPDLYLITDYEEGVWSPAHRDEVGGY